MVKNKQGISVVQKFGLSGDKKHLVGVVIDNKDYTYTLLFKDKAQLATLYVSNNQTGKSVVTLTPDAIPAKTPGRQGNASVQKYDEDVYVFSGMRVGETDVFAVKMPDAIYATNGICIKTDTRKITLMQGRENATFRWSERGIQRTGYLGSIGHEMTSPVTIDGKEKLAPSDEVEMYRLAIIGAIQKSTDVQKMKVLKALAETTDEPKIAFISALLGVHRNPQK